MDPHTLGALLLVFLMLLCQPFVIFRLILYEHLVLVFLYSSGLFPSEKEMRLFDWMADYWIITFNNKSRSQC